MFFMFLKYISNFVKIGYYLQIDYFLSRILDLKILKFYHLFDDKAIDL